MASNFLLLLLFVANGTQCFQYLSRRISSLPQRSTRSLQMNDISDEALLKSFKERVARLDAEKTIRSPPFTMYDSRKAKSMYYDSFDKSRRKQLKDEISKKNRNEGERKLKSSGTDVDWLDGDGSSLLRKFNYPSDLESTFGLTKDTPIRQLYFRKQFHPTTINDIPLVLKSLDNISFIHKGIETNGEKRSSFNNRRCVERILLALQLSDSVPHVTERWMKREASFLRAAEVKHSRVAIIAFLGMTYISFLKNWDASEWSCSCSLWCLASYVLAMVVIGSAFETSLFQSFKRDSNLESQCSAAAMASMSVLAEKIRFALRYPTNPRDDKLIIDGNTIAMIAQRAEVGHGRLAILFICANIFGFGY